MGPSLRDCAHPLTREHDVALLDLDGVVYVGPDAVPAAAEVLAAAREQGMRLAFVTNNAARPPHAVADHLTELGIAAKSSEVVTSAQAAARYLADRLPGGASVLVVGTTGLDEALRERGLKPVPDATGQVDAVVQGYSPDMNWRLLAEGAIAINRGAPWVATNVDPTVPSPRGPLPGNGSLVAALRHATRAQPVVTGKPDPTMHRESVIRSQSERPIVVGDRLDTDIEGANAVGCLSLLVLTGVTTVRDLLAAPVRMRPTYVSADLRGLLRTHRAPRSVDGAVRCGAWLVTQANATLALTRDVVAADGSSAPNERADPADDDATQVAIDVPPPFDDDALNAIRALCVASWAMADSADSEGESDRMPQRLADVEVASADPDLLADVVATDDAAQAMLDRFV